MKALELNLDFGKFSKFVFFSELFWKKSSFFNEDLSLEDDLIRKI